MKPEGFRTAYEETENPPFELIDDPSDVGDYESMQFTQHEYTGHTTESKQILLRIRNAVDAAAEEYGLPDTIVLGRQDYLAVDAMVKHDDHAKRSADQIIEPDIVTVPGRMIHVPEPNEKALITALKEKPE